MVQRVLVENLLLLGGLGTGFTVEFVTAELRKKSITTRNCGSTFLGQYQPFGWEAEKPCKTQKAAPIELWGGRWKLEKHLGRLGWTDQVEVYSLGVFLGGWGDLTA